MYQSVIEYCDIRVDFNFVQTYKLVQCTLTYKFYLKPPELQAFHLYNVVAHVRLSALEHRVVWRTGVADSGGCQRH